jgi:hypothetical protein
MRIAIDFDDTIVKGQIEGNREYDDLTTPLEFLPHAREVLYRLKDWGHTLILYSARANRAIRFDFSLDPLTKPKDSPVFASYEINRRRYQQMLDFVEEHLPNLFTYIDDGNQGKLGFDVVIDDRNYPLKPINWLEVSDYFLNFGDYVNPYNTPKKG